MTEDAWLACLDPGPMVEFLGRRRWTRNRVSDRRMRLFAASCCRQVEPLVRATDPGLRALAVAEQMADGVPLPKDFDPLALARWAYAVNDANWELREADRVRNAPAWDAETSRPVAPRPEPRYHVAHHAALAV